MSATYNSMMLTASHSRHVQAEKEVMMDSARMLQQQLALKDLVIQAFIPPPEVQKVSARPDLPGASMQGPFLCAAAAACRLTAHSHPGNCSATKCADGGWPRLQGTQSVCCGSPDVQHLESGPGSCGVSQTVAAHCHCSSISSMGCLPGV